MILDFILSFGGSRAEDWHDVSHITQLRSGKSGESHSTIFFTTPQETIVAVNSVVGDFHRTMCSVSILGEDFGITQMGCFTNF